MKLPIKSFLIIFLIILLIAAFYFVSNYDWSKSEVKETVTNSQEFEKKVKEDLQEGTYSFHAFPDTSEAEYFEGEKHQWKSALFQGVVSEFTEEKGVSYAIVRYHTDDFQSGEKKVVLQIPESMIPESLTKVGIS